MIDSHIPRFGQAILAVGLAIAFVLDARWVVPLFGVLLAAAYLGGPRWNVFAQLFKALRLPPGEPEPAAPPRFSQGLGAIFLTIATIGLFAAQEESGAWWVLGWGPALAVAVLAAVAAATPL